MFGALDGVGMDPVERALWFIEYRPAEDVSLRAAADAAGVSAHHLARAFLMATGSSLMRYARGRRLTEAARALAAGAPDILAVALSAGYGSHEAFTRAFGEQFGLTPEECRSIGTLENLKLVEPIHMDTSLLIDLDEPRFVDSAEIFIAGLSARYTFPKNEGIPHQWQKFGPHIGNLSGQDGPETYGVSCNFDNSGNFEYIAGVKVKDFGDLPEGFATMRLSPQRYAVFRHPGHVSMLRRTHYTIWNKWLPASGMKSADAPNFERYGKDFDPRAGTGTIEVWLPVARS
jgi:AraC family transcriptional regulator